MRHGRRFCLMALLLLTTAASAVAQAATQFDVITIKPHKPGDNSSMWRWTSTGYEARNFSLKSMIANAYDVKIWLVFGLPSWAETSTWDIQAKVIDPGAKPMEKLTKEERQTLMQSVLKQRFGLAAHEESKVQPVFELTVMPEGPKFKESPPLPPGTDTPKFGRGSMTIGNGTLKATAINISNLADNIAYQVDRTVVDKTGLKGEYDLVLKWTPEDRMNAAGDNGTGGDAPPSIFEALKEQLGLKLTPDKAPVPTVVVDKIEQPEAN